MNFYRGDTFIKNLYVVLKNKIKYQFQKGDKVRVIFVNKKNKTLKKEIEITDPVENVVIFYKPEETKDLTPTTYILEIEIITNDFTITKQIRLNVKEDYLNE